MNGFENIKERVELREKFKDETGDNWENSQGEPDIDYVLWLESKLFAIPNVSGSLPSDEVINKTSNKYAKKRYYKEDNPFDATVSDFKAGVQWLLGYMAGGNDR